MLPVFFTHIEWNKSNGNHKYIVRVNMKMFFNSHIELSKYFAIKKLNQEE